MSDTITVPSNVGTAGRTPLTPAQLNAQLVQWCQANNPGYTVLPGGLIEDLSSTVVGATLILDAAYTDLINSITPSTANNFLLTQLGNVQGLAQQSASNTSVYVVFTGTPGYPLPQGFTVSDGTNQYVTQESTAIGSAISGGLGVSPATYCLATASGSFAVAPGTVVNLVTSAPTGISLSVTNPNTGTPGNTTAETPGAYRARVLQANLASAQGTPRYLKTLLGAVPGVQTRLIATQQQSANGWKVIVGGGDPYLVANAILAGVADPSSLVGSTTTARNVTVSIPDSPDTYTIVFVVPPQQTVGIQVTWNTQGLNFVNQAAVQNLAIPALVSYVNSIPVGQAMNLFELYATFQTAVASIIPGPNLTKMLFTVEINGTVVNPATNTGIIAGDPESYFLTSTASVSVTEG